MFHHYFLNKSSTSALQKKEKRGCQNEVFSKEIATANRWGKAIAIVVNIPNSHLLELVQWIYRYWAFFGMENWISNQVVANGLFYMPMF